MIWLVKRPRPQARGAAGVFITDKKNDNVKDKIIMQCFIPDALRAEIAKLQTELRLKGVTKRASSISAIYTALVEAGVRYYDSPSTPAPAMPKYTLGRIRINIPFPTDTRVAINRIAGLAITQREMVNILAWWGLESFTQYVHGLPYPIAPAEKIGRPRKQKEATV